MGRGVDAVKDEIVREFQPTTIDEGHDIIDPEETLLRFSAEGRDFDVSVLMEFDQGYPNLQGRVDLNQLGPILRASETGRAVVRKTGISS